jgi:hypothetical protein
MFQTAYISRFSLFLILHYAYLVKRQAEHTAHTTVYIYIFRNFKLKKKIFN